MPRSIVTSYSSPKLIRKTSTPLSIISENPFDDVSSDGTFKTTTMTATTTKTIAKTRIKSATTTTASKTNTITGTNEINSKTSSYNLPTRSFNLTTSTCKTQQQNCDVIFEFDEVEKEIDEGEDENDNNDTIGFELGSNTASSSTSVKQPHRTNTPTRRKAVAPLQHPVTSLILDENSIQSEAEYSHQMVRNFESNGLSYDNRGFSKEGCFSKSLNRIEDDGNGSLDDSIGYRITAGDSGAKTADKYQNIVFKTKSVVDRRYSKDNEVMESDNSHSHDSTPHSSSNIEISSLSSKSPHQQPSSNFYTSQLRHQDLCSSSSFVSKFSPTPSNSDNAEPQVTGNSNYMTDSCLFQKHSYHTNNSECSGNKVDKNNNNHNNDDDDNYIHNNIRQISTFTPIKGNKNSTKISNFGKPNLLKQNISVIELSSSYDTESNIKKSYDHHSRPENDEIPNSSDSLKQSSATSNPKIISSSQSKTDKTIPTSQQNSSQHKCSTSRKSASAITEKQSSSSTEKQHSSTGKKSNPLSSKQPRANVIKSPTPLEMEKSKTQASGKPRFLVAGKSKIRVSETTSSPITTENSNIREIGKSNIRPSRKLNSSADNKSISSTIKTSSYRLTEASNLHTSNKQSSSTLRTASSPTTRKLGSSTTEKPSSLAFKKPTSLTSRKTNSTTARNPNSSRSRTDSSRTTKKEIPSITENQISTTTKNLSSPNTEEPSSPTSGNTSSSNTEKQTSQTTENLNSLITEKQSSPTSQNQSLQITRTQTSQTTGEFISPHLCTNYVKSELITNEPKIYVTMTNDRSNVHLFNDSLCNYVSENPCTTDNEQTDLNKLDGEILEWKKKVKRSVSLIKIPLSPDLNGVRRRISSFLEPNREQNDTFKSEEVRLSHSSVNGGCRNSVENESILTLSKQNCNDISLNLENEFHTNPVSITPHNRTISTTFKSVREPVQDNLKFPLNKSKQPTIILSDFDQSNKEPVRRISSIDQSALSLLKVTANKLNLPTRRPSVLAWTEQYLKSPQFRKVCPSTVEDCLENSANKYGVPGVKQRAFTDWQDVVTCIKKEWNFEGETCNRINDSLTWLRQELINIRLQDQSLAKQFLNLRTSMNAFRLAVECEGHQDLIDDAEEDMEEIRELSLLVDIPPELLSSMRSLKHIGITRWNISRRRFSTC